ncbi:hypothetical protein QBC47DRAFT_445527 [Echria macrotheca]|uniref:Protein HRI1 n=1 Tax=Echria macrotheca TaxID=438768 RepID=A0AAJ0BBV8_9PEZI|nr:hypothetical protein QBC47DRAFT_445527 [Echria macrotheca]
MGDISIREYIRWLPDPPSEPTSTIVLTSPERRFVDIRILREPEPSPDGILPPSSLDWAIAGTSTSTSSSTPGSSSPSHSTWTHWIDSRHPLNPESFSDAGDMYPQPDGTVLERGSMVNPSTSILTKYEELWRDEPVVPDHLNSEGKPVCVVLELGRGEGEGGKKRGMVVRLGQYCQALVRDGDSVLVERMRWDGETGMWVRLVRIGEGEMPVEWAAYFGGEATVGDEVKVGGDVWTVVERC